MIERRSKKLKVLVLDNNRQNRLGLLDMLETELGFDVKLATDDPKKILSYAYASDCDAVIFGDMTGDISKSELIREFKYKIPAVSIINLSGTGQKRRFYFENKSSIKELQKNLLDINEFIGSGIRGFESTIRLKEKKYLS